MSTATMTSRGRITLPQGVREDLGLVAGSQVVFVKVGPGDYRVVTHTGLSDLAGPLDRPGTPAKT